MLGSSVAKFKSLCSTILLNRTANRLTVFSHHDKQWQVGKKVMWGFSDHPSALFYHFFWPLFLLSTLLPSHLPDGHTAMQPVSQKRLAVIHASLATNEQIKWLHRKRPVQLPTVRRRVHGNFHIFFLIYSKVVMFFKGLSPSDATSCS